MFTVSEKTALTILTNMGYNKHDIYHNSVVSPDFVCSDGKQYEVKKLSGK